MNVPSTIPANEGIPLEWAIPLSLVLWVVVFVVESRQRRDREQ
jgi:hypothetical protein